MTVQIARLSLVALLVATAGCVSVSVRDTQFVLPSERPAQTEALDIAEAADAVDAIASYRFGDSRVPLARVESLVRVAAMAPADRAAMSTILSDHLVRTATPDSKQFVCRQLSLIGSSADVPAIAPLLSDDQLSDAARYALEKIPGGRAEVALIDALDETSGRAKIGIINSLGARGATNARAELRALRDDSDPAIAQAARAALDRL